MRRCCLLSAVLACTAAACGSEDRGITQPTPAVVLVHNTLNPPDDRSSLEVVNSWTGPYEPGFTSLRPSVWDDFTSTTATTIRAVSWQGGYCWRKGPGVPPSPGPPRSVASTFQVEFFPDLNGRPQDYAPLYQLTLTSAEVHEQVAFDSVRSDADCAYYDYSAVLQMPFPVTPGTRSWLLIRAYIEAGGNAWGWRLGQKDNSYSAAGTPNSGTITLTSDLAFSLSSE